ncbi:hypothetical protein LTR09_008408 [Extremus antarcticus]|uniref:SET domain-containing protein n=1 Tax=Extremus antarcticus TaxID=702011 RepID=A0AAJ0DHQ8_9PEZI|nr:hypothetical protein LTR09_008408 [Extremus antarcticus]
MATITDEVKLERFPHLYVKLDTPKGRGVFSTAPICKGTILDICPVLVLPPDEITRHIEHTTLNHYTYNWPSHSSAKHEDSKQPNGQLEQSSREPRRTTTQAIVLGLGSMFNHSRLHQNVAWQRDLERQVVVYRALRDIAADEELCISYGDRLTFKDAEQDGVCTDQESEIEVLSRIELEP